VVRTAHIYLPLRNNTELNFVCLHPDTESDGSNEGSLIIFHRHD
jgi:hypothetical protein